jgi:uncharacterized membrane protein
LPILSPSRLLVAAAVAALVLGVWFRVAGLDRKMFWYDEIGTSMTLSAHTAADLRTLYDGRPRRAADLRRLVAPDAGSPGGVVRALIATEPHTPPAFILLARAAAGPLGTIGPRAVSVVASVAALFLVWLLARALFADARAGWLAAALMAVSPLHVRYAQEARPYALWSLAVLAASVLLLRARRRGTWGGWVAYAVAAAAALHTHLLSLLVLLAHAVFVALLMARPDDGPRARRGGRPWTPPAMAFAAALLSFAPWASVVVSRRDTVRAAMEWADAPATTTALVARWVGTVTAVFLRSGAEGGWLGGASDAWTTGARVALSLAVLALVVGCAYVLVSETSRATWLFVALLGIVPALGLVFSDVAWGGRRSMIPRYLVPCWIAAELGVAGALARRMRTSAWAPTAVALALLVAGAASVGAAAPLRTWWDTNPPALRAVAAAARRIEASAAPVVVSDAPPVPLFVLLWELRADATVRLVTSDAGPALAGAAASPLLLYDPSAALVAAARGARPGLRPCVRDAGVELWCEAP